MYLVSGATGGMNTSEFALYFPTKRGNSPTYSCNIPSSSAGQVKKKRIADIKAEPATPGIPMWSPTIVLTWRSEA